MCGSRILAGRICMSGGRGYVGLFYPDWACWISIRHLPSIYPSTLVSTTYHLHTTLSLSLSKNNPPPPFPPHGYKIIQTTIPKLLTESHKPDPRARPTRWKPLPFPFQHPLRENNRGVEAHPQNRRGTKGERVESGVCARNDSCGLGGWVCVAACTYISLFCSEFHFLCS